MHDDYDHTPEDELTDRFEAMHITTWYWHNLARNYDMMSLSECLTREFVESGKNRTVTFIRR
jgi:hypothetical protein